MEVGDEETAPCNVVSSVLEAGRLATPDDVAGGVSLELEIIGVLFGPHFGVGAMGALFTEAPFVPESLELAFAALAAQDIVGGLVLPFGLEVPAVSLFSLTLCTPGAGLVAARLLVVGVDS
jgi:hypothetical protein